MAKQSMPSTYGHKREMQCRKLDRIGVEQYISEDFYKKELKTIWRKCWLWAGRANEIPNPGEYFVLNLPFFDRTSILVIRGKDDKVRAF